MRTLPCEILLDFNLDDKTLLADSLSELAGRRVNVQTKPRGDRARYLKLARTNAATALSTKLSQQSTVHQRLAALASAAETAGSETDGVFRHQPYDGRTDGGVLRGV